MNVDRTIMNFSRIIHPFIPFTAGLLPILHTQFRFSMHKLLFGLLLFFASSSFAQTAPKDTTGINALYNKILNLDETVRNEPSRQVSNFNPSDTASLPIGIEKEIGNSI